MEVLRDYLWTTHIGTLSQILSWKLKCISFSTLYGCPKTMHKYYPENWKTFLYLIWVSKKHANAFFGHPYNVEKEIPFNFQDNICDRAPRRTYVGGQEVISCNFIFPPCVHFLYLGAKMQCVYGYIQNINFKKVYFHSWKIFICLLLCFSIGESMNCTGGHC